MDGEQNQTPGIETIHSEGGTATVSPQGGYVTSWKTKHPKTGELTDILYIGKTIKRTGIPILFPQFGDAPSMRKHGFGRDSSWAITQQNDASISLTLTDQDIAEDAKKEYSFEFKAVITVSIEANGSLLYSLVVTNTGGYNLPISPGLHPYWAIPHAKKKEFKIDGVSGFDASIFDWDNSPPDTAFAYNGKVTATLPDREITIEDVTTPSPVIKHIVVWSQPITMDDYHFVCIEPICGYNNELVTGPILIKPNTVWQMSVRFSATLHE